jgi:hypothetical protein
MNPPEGITTRILPTTPQDIERNVVRVEVTAPRHRGFTVMEAPEQTDVTVVNDVNVIAPQGGHTINYPHRVVMWSAATAGSASNTEEVNIAANPAIDPAASMVVSGGWCAPSQTVYELAGQMDYNEVGEMPTFPRGGARFNLNRSIEINVGQVDPAIIDILTGYTGYVHPAEETLL